MTNQPPMEFWLERYNGNGSFKVLNCEPNIVSDSKIILNGVTMSAYTYFHVIEAGPALEKIKRLEAALQKCKEQRNWFIKCLLITRIELEELKEANDKELESILGGR